LPDRQLHSPSTSLETASTFGTSLAVSRSGSASGDSVLGTDVIVLADVAEGARVGVTGALGSVVLRERYGMVSMERHRDAKGMLLTAIV
jgi:hypothetical protein